MQQARKGWQPSRDSEQAQRTQDVQPEQREPEAKEEPQTTYNAFRPLVLPQPEYRLYTVLMPLLHAHCQHFKRTLREIYDELFCYLYGLGMSDIQAFNGVFGFLDPANGQQVCEFVDSLSFNWREDVQIVAVRQLSSTCYLSKFVSQYALSVNVAKVGWENLADYVWADVFDAMAYNSRYSHDFQAEDTFIVVRRVADQQLFRCREFDGEFLGALAEQLDGALCDCIVLTVEHFEHIEGLNIRHLTYIFNRWGQHDRLTLGHPRSLESCSLSCAELANADECGRLRSMCCDGVFGAGGAGA